MTRLNSKIGIHKIRLSSVDSTNNFAAKLVNEGLCEHGSVIMADKQTNGRGQRDAEWQSEEKMNLLTSFVFQFKNIDNKRLTNKFRNMVRDAMILYSSGNELLADQ